VKPDVQVQCQAVGEPDFRILPRGRPQRTQLVVRDAAAATVSSQRGRAASASDGKRSRREGHHEENQRGSHRPGRGGEVLGNDAQLCEAGRFVSSHFLAISNRTDPRSSVTQEADGSIPFISMKLLVFFLRSRFETIFGSIVSNQEARRPPLRTAVVWPRRLGPRHWRFRPQAARRTNPVTEFPRCGPITRASSSYYLSLAAPGAGGVGFISLASLAASFRLQGGTILLERAYATDCPRCSLM
jgi:hypothetical protein